MLGEMRGTSNIFENGNKQEISNFVSIAFFGVFFKALVVSPVEMSSTMFILTKTCYTRMTKL